MFDNLTDKLDKAFHILKGHEKTTSSFGFSSFFGIQ
jgi:hypothetical protein